MHGCETEISTTSQVFGKGRALEDEFNSICKAKAGDLVSRRKADEWLATTDARYHGGPLSWAFTPKIFTRAEVDALADIAHTMGRIMDKLTQRFLEDKNFRSKFQLTQEMEELCCMQAGYEQLIPISRVDIFLNEETGDFQFCELNTDGSAGMNATVEVTRAIQSSDTYHEFAKQHPNISSFDVERLACEAVLACYKSWEHAGNGIHPVSAPQLLFVDYDESASHGEVDSLCRRFAELGVSARFSDIRDLRIDTVDGVARLCDTQGPVDCVWRRAVTGEMLDKPCAGADALIEAGRRSLACIVGSFRTWPCHTKTVFALLWSESVCELLSDEELAFVRAHVPETHVLSKESNLDDFMDKDSWIVKPADGYNAVGVVAGLETDELGWRKALEQTAAIGGIVQRYAQQYATPMAIGGRLVEGAAYTDMQAREDDRQKHATDFVPANNMEGLYLFNGKFSGVYTRCGYQPTIGEWTNRFHMGCIVVEDA